MKKLDLVSHVKLQTHIWFLIGLALGIIYSFGGLIIDSLVSLDLVTSPETPGLSYGTLLAFGALIGMPSIGAIFGLITGIVGVLIYNSFLKIIR